MADWGFAEAASSPCMFRHATRALWVDVHGDDFITLGGDVEIAWLKDNMVSAYQCKLVSKVGPQPDDCKSMRILNRVLEWTPEGIYLEADQRHAEIIIKELGLEDCKGGGAPGAKDKDDEIEAE